MKLHFFRRLGAMILCAATGAAMTVPAMAQATAGSVRQSSPPRQGNTANDELGLQGAYDSQRDYTNRVEFMSDLRRQGETWDAAWKFAACAVGFNAERVRDLLDQAVEKDGGKKVDLGTFLNRNQGCVASYTGVDRDFIRGAMAETLLTAQGAPAIPAPGDADAVKAFIKAVKAPSAKTDDPFVMGQLGAECRTGFAPMQVRALLATEPGSEAEKGALAVLKAVTPQCASFAVADKPLTPYFERAYAAQALYHWTGLGPKLTKK
jgi:hypothetical protein